MTMMISSVLLQKFFSLVISTALTKFIKVVLMDNPFKLRHFQPEIIFLTVKWYLRYSLSYRDLKEMMTERGLSIDHSTIHRWLQNYAPELEKRIRPNLKHMNDSWQVDETHVKVKREWMYLYRAVDSTRFRIRFIRNCL